MIPETWEMTAATKAKKPAKPREPEQVWYDVHKHPLGVPGGMGKSPEHHLRNRGWSSHEIHGATNKTIQYHNPKYPDFVISYGGGSSTKPDHNFGITYLGTNTNIPKKHRAYSVAEAMNKVEELHQLQAGHIVLPMTHAASGPLGYDYAISSPEGLSCPGCGSGDLYSRGFRMRQEEPDLGCNNCGEHLHSPRGSDVVSDAGWEKGQDASGMTYGAAYAPAARTTTPKPSTVAQQPNVSLQNTFVAPGELPKPPDMTDDDAHPIGPPKVTFPTKPDREKDWPKKQKAQLNEIPAAPAPSQVGATKYGSAYQVAQRDTWEE